MKINIAKDFSEAPFGRYKNQGDFSGELFRDDYLVPAFNKKETVEVILDGTFGFGSSFLEEAFGGLVRVHNIDKEIIRSTLKIISEEDPSYINEIYEYIASAEQA